MIKRPALFLKLQCERLDKLLSLDHSVARKASEEYDAAFHDAVHALAALRLFARELAEFPSKVVLCPVHSGNVCGCDALTAEYAKRREVENARP